MDSGHRLAWRAHAQTSDVDAACRVAARMSDVIGRPLDELQVERYEKLPELHVFQAITPLRSDKFSDVIVEVLQVASGMTSHWSVNAPEEFPNGEWSFSGLASRPRDTFRVPGVEMVTWTLRRHGADDLS